MAVFSILPNHLSVVETWVIRTCLVLAVICVGPWVAILIYDILFYLWRSATYEMPYVGGRARGRARPHAPSLSERPDGYKRRLSMRALSAKHHEPETVTTDAQLSSGGSKRQKTRHQESPATDER